MGFDQYHEPPEELPQETRTFARLCASLTEEAEAIGWYEQRIAIEPDPEAAAIMRDAVGEEYKHFSMDLEFLLRRTPVWRETARGILFREGDIVENGERSEASADDLAPTAPGTVLGADYLGGGAPVTDPATAARPGGSLGIGSLKGRTIMSNHLLRSHAPLSDGNWALVDDEARERLTAALAARRLVDFVGPLGWTYSATNLGRVEGVSVTPGPGVSALRRRVLPLVEIQAAFSLSRAELRDDDRGAADADLEPLDRAAHDMAVAENTAVFHGWAQASIVGIAEASPHQGLTLPGEADGYPRPVASAVEQLLQSGVEGPYGLAVGSDAFKRVSETAEHGGYPLRDHLAKVLEGGPIVWAPGVDGAVVVSLRGGDFRFESGQDLSVGYLEHDRETVTLYLEQSFSFHVATPEAAVPLKSP